MPVAPTALAPVTLDWGRTRYAAAGRRQDELVTQRLAGEVGDTLVFTEHEPFRVCIGIGHGRVLANGRGGVMGEEINLVAKLAEDIAPAGETLLTESAYRSLTTHANVPVEKPRSPFPRST